MVYLKLQSYRQHNVAHHVNYKLAPTQCIGDVAYRLELSASASDHPVFHMSSLKKHVGSSTVVSSSLPLLDSHGGFRTDLEVILQRRMHVVDNKPLIEFLVK